MTLNRRGASPRPAVALAAVVLAGSLLAACGGTSTPSSGAQASESPVPGGTLTFAMSNLTPTLDPTVLAGGGTVGSIELQAIYDTLMVFDEKTGTYVGHTAQSLTPNADFTVWTLKLKPDIKFTDGTAYDADAVKFNIDRNIAPTSKASDKALLTTFLASTTVVDPTTVTFTLKQGWAQFPYVLSDEAGMIASPKQVQALGANFVSTVSPAGAGPFKMTSYKPGSQLSVARNDSYYGTKPYLDAINFVAPPADTQVAEKNVAGKQFDVAYTTDSLAGQSAKNDGLDVLTVPSNADLVVIMNSAKGSPLNNVAVRQAVAAAIDPQQINTRVYQGALQLSPNLLTPGSVYDPKVAGPKFDLDKAKSLVTQAKASGFDGKVTLTVGTDPTSTNWATTMKAMLDRAGFETSLIPMPSANIVSQVLVKKDFQMASWGMSFDDSNAYFRLFQSFNSAAPRYGYSSPAMDAALAKLQVASSKADVTAAMGDISKILNQDVPFLSLAYGTHMIMSNKNVHGLVLTSNQAVLLGGVWVSKS